MAFSSGTSFVITLITSILIFSGLQMYKPLIISSQLLSLFSGYIGALFFICVLTAIGNLGSFIYGKSYQLKTFPEVIGAFTVALFLAASIHRVCFTSCLLCSSFALYYINRYSQKVYATPVEVGERKKKR